MHNIKILGAAGSRTNDGGNSAFLISNTQVIDAGNLLLPLQEQNAYIDKIWLTHSHLDHVADIAYILDNYYEQREKTLTICGLKETLDIVKKHLLNDEIWPDFSSIPLKNSSAMSLEYKPLKIGQRYTVNKNKSIYAFRTDHTVPSCGYVLSGDSSSLLISADTLSLDSTIQTITENNHIKSIVLECSFPSSMEQLAISSKHLTPKLLFEKIAIIQNKNIKLLINHIKPAYRDQIIKEIEELKGPWDTTILSDGDTICF